MKSSEVSATSPDRLITGAITLSSKTLFPNRRNLKLRLFFPDISDILKIVDPKLSESDNANEIAGSIIESIARFGRNRGDEVRAEIGETAWHCVKRFGGWKEICNVEQSQLNTLRAQLREMSKASVKISVQRENNDQDLVTFDDLLKLKLEND